MRATKAVTDMTTEEKAQNDAALIRQYAEALVTTGQLLLTAIALDNWALLDWQQILQYVGESGEDAMEAAGFGADAAKAARRGAECQP